MDTLKDAPNIDFGIKLKSKGLNKLVQALFVKIPEKPPQKIYRQRLRDCFRIVLINLINADEYIRYSRDDHSKTYEAVKYSAKNIRKVVNFLESGGMVESKRGYNFSENPESRRMSRMRCRHELRNLFAEYQIQQSDIQINTKKDLIILRDKSKRSISYAETPSTLSARENIKKINELSAYHSILDGSGRHIHRTIQHRVFNLDFQHGGRFYGGEWQSLNSKERLKLKIDNTPVVEYDYSALHPTMLYALNDLPLKGDPYSLKGYSSETRKFLKIVMLALVNTGDKFMTKKAILKMINFGELEKPTEVTSLDDLLTKFIEKHEPIVGSFNPNTGLRLQRLDSDICERVMLRFYQQDILVLGVHDSFVVRQDYGETLYEVMNEVFFDKFGNKCQVARKAEKNSIPCQSLSGKGLQRF